jgi:hypothetical protein
MLATQAEFIAGTKVLRRCYLRDARVGWCHAGGGYQVPFRRG